MPRVQSGGIGKLVMVQVNRHGWGGHTRPTPPGFNESQVRWDLFLRDTKQYPFDPQRYLNWRRYVEYSNGAAGDLMLHHLDIFHFISGCTMPVATEYASVSARSYTAIKWMLPSHERSRLASLPSTSG